MLVLLSIGVIAGCTDALGQGDSGTDSQAARAESMLPMTITDWLFAPEADHATAEPVGVAHLSMTPMEPGANDLSLTLTDLDGAPLPGITDASDVVLTYRALQPDAADQEIEMSRAPEQPATWRSEQVDLDAAWYAFHIALTTNDGATAVARLYALLPDPSVHGAESVQLPPSDPEAEAIYRKALASYASWSSARWRESLGSGTDALVVTRFALTSRPSEAAAQSMHSEYAASYRDRTDGSRPAPPQHDFAARVAIGSDMWSRTDAGTWEPVDGFNVATFAERAGIYDGATNVQFGGTEMIDGREADIVTFFLPQKQGQSEAWFAWWIDAETGDPLRIMMVAQMHFMIWDIYDINDTFSIEPPAADRIATPTAGA